MSHSVTIPSLFPCVPESAFRRLCISFYIVPSMVAILAVVWHSFLSEARSPLLSQYRDRFVANCCDCRKIWWWIGEQKVHISRTPPPGAHVSGLIGGHRVVSMASGEDFSPPTFIDLYHWNNPFWKKTRTWVANHVTAALSSRNSFFSAGIFFLSRILFLQQEYQVWQTLCLSLCLPECYDTRQQLVEKI